jgi:hypothetical protein
MHQHEAEPVIWKLVLQRHNKLKDGHDQQHSPASALSEAGNLLPIPTHPDEMSAQVVVKLSGGNSLVATARTTPAGLRAVGVLVAAVLLSAAVVVRAAKQRV